ncbi:MAG: hypothetical protein CMM87_04520 [Rickettsiales bacterium]|nr:hypothetical protein [Rickettsiales bacterium]|tara:strand:+ start:12660 stop:13133 length:474 start_codon:yes stop_codon:yes gene_type:complete
MSQLPFPADYVYKPLKLIAKDPEDLKVISTLLQDSIITNKTIKHDKGANQLSFLANRFRWELTSTPDPYDEYERVFALVVFDNVTNVCFEKINPKDSEVHHNLLGVIMQSSGNVVCHFSDDAKIILKCSNLHVRLKDVSDPWPSEHKPKHPEVDENA